MSHILPERYLDLSNPTKYQPKERHAWERNVVDEYKALPDDAIRQAVEAKRLPCAVLMTHLELDFNLGAVLRLGNCLGARVYYYGRKKFDKRSAVGAWHYTPITHLKTLEEVGALKGLYSFVALEQTTHSVPLPQFQWAKNSLIIVGEEGSGLQAAPEILALADHCVEIPQRGSVRSLNAASACAIATYDYIFKMTP